MLLAIACFQLQEEPIIEIDDLTEDEIQELAFIFIELAKLEEQGYDIARIMSGEDIDGLPKWLKAGVCKVCKLVIGAMRKYLNKDSTREQVVRLLSKVCNILPFYVAPVCKKIISKGARKLVDWIVEHHTTDGACKSVGACK
uniref:Saposin-like type B domin-containing protein n=1 Tax=Trepomonas sp. PC1 TaxID=1076344 RepID=A0A146K2L3_9EUKA|eukprot:JAP91123.1 Saposin-like type B domin-containing protein [Trepomonas sp. PC1]